MQYCSRQGHRPAGSAPGSCRWSAGALHRPKRPGPVRNCRTRQRRCGNVWIRRLKLAGFATVYLCHDNACLPAAARRSPRPSRTFCTRCGATSMRRAEASILAERKASRRTSEVATAEKGETGLDGSDDWAHELFETGSLHSHACMRFASIRIFTLRLPWPRGDNFFPRHLTDPDPPSNTLSWRWDGAAKLRDAPSIADNVAAARCR